MSGRVRDALGQVSWTTREYASRERLRRQALVARGMELPQLGRRRRVPGQVWGVAMVRDEADVLGVTVRHLLDQGVDHLLIVDNGSVDGTRAMLEDFASSDGRVHVGVDPVVPYYQSEKMTWLAHVAWRAGADWVVPFDADEWWFADDGQRLGEHLRASDCDVLYARLHHMVPTTGHPDDLANAEFILDATPGFPGKVAFRSHPLARVERGNHAVARVGRVGSSLRIAHAIYRGPRQVIRKVRQGTAAAELTGDDVTVLTPHWASAVEHSDAAIEQMWRRLALGAAEPQLGVNAIGPMLRLRPGTWRSWDPDGRLTSDDGTGAPQGTSA